MTKYLNKLVRNQSGPHQIKNQTMHAGKYLGWVRYPIFVGLILAVTCLADVSQSSTSGVETFIAEPRQSLLSQLYRLPTFRKTSRKLMIALRLLNYDPDITLEKMVPQVIPLDSLGNVTELKRCYNDLVGKKRINVFQTPIRKVVKTFFEQNLRNYKGVNRLIDVLKRVETFVRNLREFAELIGECLASPPEKQTKYGLTPLSAMTAEERQNLFNPKLELEARLGGLAKKNRTKRSNEPGTCTYYMDEPLQEMRFDWRDYGVVTRVKNQGQCSSSFIFSPMAAFESAVLRRLRIQGRALDAVSATMSEQSVLNCFQCGGGFIRDTFEHLMRYGAPNEREVPFRARPEQCNQYRPLFKLDNYCQFDRPLTDTQIQMLVQKYGPVTAAISASSREFIYLRGKFNGDGCTDELNHSVVIIGWDENYWIIKNNWSDQWGEGGYLYLPRGKGLCGINRMITVPIWYGNV